MPMEKEDLVYPTSLWHQRRRVREPEIAGRDGEPRSEVSPAMEDIELAAFVVRGVGLDEGVGVVERGERCSSRDGCGFITRCV